MVEVTQHNEDSSTLFTKSVLNGNFDIIESDVSSSGCWRVGSLDGLGLDTLATFDQDDSETIFRFATDCEAIQTFLSIA